MAAQFPSAEVPTLDAIASSSTTSQCCAPAHEASEKLATAAPNLDAIEPSTTEPSSPEIALLAHAIHEVRAFQRRGKQARSIVEFGRSLLKIKTMVARGQFSKVVSEQLGMDRKVAGAMMRAARLDNSELFLSLNLSTSALVRLLWIGEDHLQALADGQTVCGYALQDFSGMTEKKVCEVAREIKRAEDLKVATGVLLRPGDRVESLHAGRLGEVVKVYADASACIRWDDGEPQEAGLGHERMPRELLKKVDGAKVAPAAAPAAVEVEEIEVHAVPPDPADTPPTPAARPSMAEREEYCEALFELLFGHADDAALDELCDTMEAMLDTMASRRPRSALAQAWGDLFARFAVKGGV